MGTRRLVGWARTWDCASASWFSVTAHVPTFACFFTFRLGRHLLAPFYYMTSKTCFVHIECQLQVICTV
jgi:hypothetical protein